MKRTKAQILEGVESVVQSKIVANNTVRYETEDSKIIWRLHRTDILVHYPLDVYLVNTGGYSTVTTRDRLNRFLPAGYRVHVEQGQLYLNDRPMHVRATIAGNRITTDIGQDFARPYSFYRPYVERYIKQLREQGLPAADTVGGDPFIFPNRETGKYSPDVVQVWLGVPDVVRQHGDDPADYPYIFRTFVTNALRWAGAGDQQIQFRYYMLEHDHRNWVMGDITRTVRRYIRACLGYSV